MDSESHTTPTGAKVWRHCTDGINEVLHRDDGPAIIHPDGRVCWIYEGNMLSFDKWCTRVDVSDEEKMWLILKYG
jgi:hypothetical protein